MPKFMISKKLQGLKSQFYKQNFLQKYQLNSKSGIIILMILISVTGLLYLFQINALATKGYEMKDLEEKSAELREQNKKLQLVVTDLRSTERITNEVARLEMVEVAKVEYLKANGTSVAVNR